MEKLIGKINYNYFKFHKLDYHLPEFHESLVKYIYHCDITEDKLKSIKFINITFYNKWLQIYLPQMINLETIFISFDGYLENVKKNYALICKSIPNTIKTLIIYHNSIAYLTDLLNNLPITTQKLIILDYCSRNKIFQNKDIVEELKKNFKSIPFGCKIYYCFEDENNNFQTNICLI